MKTKEREEVITPELEVFAKKVTSYLGKNPNVSIDVENRLFVARNIAITGMKTNEFVVTEEEKESVSQWFKKQYISFSNGVVALAIMVAAVPLGMNVVSFEDTKTFKSVAVSADVSEDYYLENIYHLEADNFDKDYLQEMGFI